MVKVFEGTESEYYMDGYLRDNINFMKTAIKSDWDMIVVVDGAEGSGKSVLAQQMAYYCDPSLTLDRITFTPPEFKNAIIDAKPYQAVIYDEAYGGLSSRQTMSQTNQAIVKMLAEIRQKNLFVFIVLPCFFDLDKYVALWRSRALVHVYTEGFIRGRFQFYNQTKKKNLYIFGKKFYSYKVPRSNFYGSFTNHYVIDENAYRAKKLESLNAHIEDVGSNAGGTVHKYKSRMIRLIKFLHEDLELSYDVVGKIIEVKDVAQLVRKFDKSYARRTDNIKQISEALREKVEEEK